MTIPTSSVPDRSQVADARPTPFAWAHILVPDAADRRHAAGVVRVTVAVLLVAFGSIT